MRLQLRTFRLTGDWSPLLERIGGWHKIQALTWSDGVSKILLSSTSPFGFVSEDARSVPAFRISPSGIAVEFAIAECLSKHSQRYIMNHVSLNVDDVDQEVAWYEDLLGSCTVIARKASWDPILRRMLPDAHLFRRPDFYITIRGGFHSPAVDHIGWHAHSRSDVDVITATLREIGWPVVLGPELIDSSYLVHFRGPDGRVHDFFYPESCLDRATV